MPLHPPSALHWEGHPVMSDTHPPEPRSPIRSCRSEEHTSELQSHVNLVCRLLLEKKNSTVHGVDGCRTCPPWKLPRGMHSAGGCVVYYWQLICDVHVHLGLY